MHQNVRSHSTSHRALRWAASLRFLRSAAAVTRYKMAPVFAAVALAAVTVPSHAAVLTWDSDANATNGPTDGTGTWNTNTTANWYDVNTATDQVWNADTAVFGTNAATATAYTVTVAGAVTDTGSITFNQSGYTIATSTNNVLTLAPTNNVFTFTTSVSGGTDTVGTASVPFGTTIVKTGPGTLALNTLNLTGTGNPIALQVTGGAFNAATGVFDSIYRSGSGFGNGLGTSPAVTAPATQFILDAGTLNFTGTGNVGIGGTRNVIINAGGGSIIDPGSNQYQSNIANGAASTSSLYVTSTGGTTTAARFTSVQNSGAPFTSISGAGSFTKLGAGTVTLEAANTYSGGTVVNAGTLLATNNGNGITGASSTGTGAVTVGNTAGTLTGTLGGSGTILGATTINAGSRITGGGVAGGFTGGGTVGGGVTVATVGTLTLQSTLNITGGTYVVDLSGTTSDRLTIGGALNLSNANITFSGTPTANTTFVLATYTGGVTGTFVNSLPPGYSLVYNAGELDLTVPEPATWLAGCLLVGLTCLSQRRRFGAVLKASGGC